jgi:hypothetical protein
VATTPPLVCLAATMLFGDGPLGLPVLVTKLVAKALSLASRQLACRCGRLSLVTGPVGHPVLATKLVAMDLSPIPVMVMSLAPATALPVG